MPGLRKPPHLSSQERYVKDRVAPLSHAVALEKGMFCMADA